MRAASLLPPALPVVVLLMTSCAAGPSTAAVASSPPVTPAPLLHRGSVVVVLGDSYTVGVGSADGTGYVGDLRAQEAWDVVPVAESGTGYVNPGAEPWQSVYGERVGAVAAADPDLVVVQGSTNDVGTAAPGDTRRAAEALYAQVSEELPDVQIVVLGPVDAPVVDPAGVRAVRAELATAAASAKVPFIDPIALDWLPSDDLYDDGLHPNQAGYAEFAADLADAVADLGL